MMTDETMLKTINKDNVVKFQIRDRVKLIGNQCRGIIANVVELDTDDYSTLLNVINTFQYI
jgi:hypothetical protein